ncbi:MAG: zinc ribbon domain-containing protein [Candidatus Eremiobacteraeota bacterium]|nr:zinc ribbon domain-containing protein [Candidatus Eremiobacteraeota bacterium]
MIPRADSDHPIDKIRFGLMVAIGGEDATETLEEIQRQEHVARRELEEVPQRAAARGEEFLKGSEEVRTELLSQLEAYLSWLESAREALEQHDTGRLMEIHEASQDILPGLNAALDAYARVFSTYGPYGSPPANMMFQIMAAINSGEQPKFTWGEYCEFYAKTYEEKAETVGEIELPGRTNYKKSCHTIIDLMDGWMKDVPESAEAAHETLVEIDLAARFAGLFEMEVSSAKAGPTGIPSTNVMLDYLNGYIADMIPAEVVASVMDDYADLMDRYAENFENSASRPTDSALVQEEIPRTLDALDEHFAVIEDMSESTGELSKEKAKEWMERLKSTAEPLEESAQVYATAAQHQHNIACPGCGRSNPPENRNCEACGEVLPRPEDTGALQSSTFSVLAGPTLEENQQMPMTENVARLFQACDDVNDGVITPQEFSAEVQRAALGLKEFAEELDGVAAIAMDEENFTPEQWETWQTHHMPYLEDIAATYVSGLKEAEEGLQSMEEFLSDPDDAHLVEGIRLVWQGLSAVHRGRLSMETYTKMLQDVVQESVDEGLISTEAEG